MDMNLIYWQPVIALLAGGITEAMKKAFLPSKYCGLVSYGLGLVFGVLVAVSDPKTPMLEAVLGGLVAGAAASGGYSGIKKLTEK